MLFDIDKISLKEAFNNADGKTSANKLIGVLTSLVCMILVIFLIVFYFFNVAQAPVILQLIDKTITYFACAAALMGVKSFSSALWRKNTNCPPIIPGKKCKETCVHEETTIYEADEEDDEC